jgi:hypothetical protein
MNRALLYVIFVLIAGFSIIQGIRLLFGVGWSWIDTAGYGVAFVALCIAARRSRNAPTG